MLVEVVAGVVAPRIVMVEEGLMMGFAEGTRGDGLMEVEVAGRRVDTTVGGLEVTRAFDLAADTTREVDAVVLVVFWTAFFFECLEDWEDRSSDEREGRESESHFIKSSFSTWNSNVGGGKRS